MDLAIAEYKEALRLNPRDAQAHNNLGNVLAEQGRLDEVFWRQKQQDLVSYVRKKG